MVRPSPLFLPFLEVSLLPLSDEDRSTYAWQMAVTGVGEEGQAKLKGASVLVTRVGGVGGLVAYELAAAGVGRLILAHAGTLKPSDLNRQLLMNHGAIGQSRVECAAQRLKEFNPRLEIEAIGENASAENASRLVEKADLVVCCAPMFAERLALNEACVQQKKPMVDCAMYDLTGQVTTIRPKETACLACRVPEVPASWKRQFPVFGAIAGTVGCLGAMEAIKLITGIGEPLLDRLLTFDLRDMRFRTLSIAKRVDCAVCGSSQ
jgi:molybdopterin/thiamine biosynthesis adenylyltransferase